MTNRRKEIMKSKADIVYYFYLRYISSSSNNIYVKISHREKDRKFIINLWPLIFELDDSFLPHEIIKFIEPHFLKALETNENEQRGAEDSDLVKTIFLSANLTRAWERYEKISSTRLQENLRKEFGNIYDSESQMCAGFEVIKMFTGIKPMFERGKRAMEKLKDD